MLFLFLTLAAAPVADSRWQWKLDDTRELNATIDGRRAETTSKPHLGRITLGVEVKEAGEEAPRKLLVKVVAGGGSLEGRSFAVESNYGEAVLKELNPKKAGEEVPIWPGEEEANRNAQRLLGKTMGLLLTGDPIVIATSGLAPCSEESRAKVVAAVAKRTALLLHGGDGGDTAMKDGSATCGKTMGSYSVAFTINAPVGSAAYDFPFKGTVEVLPGAWRANFALKSAAKFNIDTRGHKAKASVKLTVSSSMIRQ